MSSETAWVFPGQGSQQKGMGAEVFERYRGLVDRASDVLGWDLGAQSLDGADPGLTDTRALQPALYFVECLTARAALDDGVPLPGAVSGHSLGEYAALQVAGALDLFDGLRLVAARGALMGEATGGGMAALVGVDEQRTRELLAEQGNGLLDLANVNSHEQIVVSGPVQEVSAFAGAMREIGVRCVPLAASAAFHSRYMAPAAESFVAALAECPVRDPLIPVVSNVTAAPYAGGTVRDLLRAQIESPVLWWQCQATLRSLGVDTIIEMGPGQVLTRLWEATADAPPPPRPEPVTPSVEQPAEQPAEQPITPPVEQPAELRVVVPPDPVAEPAAARLGSPAFRDDYGLDLACLSGSMYRGISSVDLVARMGEAGMMGFFGAGGLAEAEIDAALAELTDRLGQGARFGVNLIASTASAEAATVDLALRHGVRYVEASSFTGLSANVVRFRFTGASLVGGRPRFRNHVIVKASRPEVAASFLQPAPRDLVDELVRTGGLTREEGAVAAAAPVAGDLCVECDSGGHTDGGNPFVLLPVMRRLRDELAPESRIGVSGGLGDPQAVAVAFQLGADFVVTGSVNQATVEAGTSPTTKELLTRLDINDTTYAPAGDMFEVGANVQVVRKRTLFPARANKLLQLGRAHASLDDLPRDVAGNLQDRIFRRSFDEIWSEVSQRDAELGRSEMVSPRQRMIKTFRWYFAWTTMLALEGDPAQLVNYQIHCGPAIGALNRYLADGPRAEWSDRHVDVVNRLLLEGAAEIVGDVPHSPRTAMLQLASGGRS